MKNFFIIVNAEKAMAGKTRHTIEAYLKNNKGVVSYTVWDGQKQDRYELPEGCDCIITIGGDGTLIQAARATVGSKVPLIGINRGHMGYLTQLSDERMIVPALKRLIDDDYTLEERMMLDAEVIRDGRSIYKEVALNEVMLTRFNSIRTLNFQVYVNDKLLNEYSADGILAATPTGSTAYSLSAGGPIAEPEARLIILTPICSHAINSRSIIFSPKDRIKLIACSRQQVAACDGESILNVEQGDEILIRMSKHSARFVRLREESFLDTLRQKMTFV
ncbi:MAG TPA: NAD(+)/NADH kinase [Candidatus Avilachnospira avistercoris]|nr:NAD(+)/NADH kinase [Candidatus Avilachnospira avistercoris]